MMKQFKVIVEKHPDDTWIPLTLPIHTRTKQTYKEKQIDL